MAPSLIDFAPNDFATEHSFELPTSREVAVVSESFRFLTIPVKSDASLRIYSHIRYERFA